MLVPGRWFLCADLVSRPIVELNVATAGDDWLAAKFLLDSGADRTVFSNELRCQLGIASAENHELGGVGGHTRAELLRTKLRLNCDDGTVVTINGEFAAFTQDEALDMSVLGRDVMNLFAVIVDRPGDAVCLLGQRHRYRVEAV